MGDSAMSDSRFQVVWIWERGHLPEGETRKWHFAAHGARYDRESAEEMAALLRSHGKRVRFLVI